MLERFREPARGVQRKSSRTDLVSDADRDAESLIRDLLLTDRPADGLIGEEGSQSEADNGRHWIVDPLDGTTNFLYGLPTWGVSIALEDEQGPAVGVVHDPCRAETFTALRGGGAALDGERIAVSGNETLETALIATGFSYRAGERSDQAHALTDLLPRVRDIRRAGAAALDLCAVAAGRVDGYFERSLQHWDWAAGSLVALEAGASLIPLDGEPSGLIAATPGIALELAELVG